MEESGSLTRRVLLNTGSLSGSSLWRIGISFLLQLLIARIIGVQALGVYTVALAYLNVGQVMSELGLPALYSRDLAGSPHHRRAYYVAALRVQIAAAFVIWAGFIALTFVLPYGLNERIALNLIGASLPFYAVTSASQTIFRASERMELVLFVEGFINLLILAISLVVLLTAPRVDLLITVLVVTQAISAIICVITVRQTGLLAQPQEHLNVGIRRLWASTSTFFGLSIAEVLQQRMDILLLSVVAGPAVTGIYSAAYNLVRVVVKLVQSFWQALYPTFSRLYHQQSPTYAQLSELSLRYGLLALFLCATIVTAMATTLIRVVYSAQYDETAVVLQWLIWVSPVLFIESYAVVQLMVQGRPRLSLGIILLNLVVLLVTLPWLASQLGAVGAAIASLVAVISGAAFGLVLLQRVAIPCRLRLINSLVLVVAIATSFALYLPVNWPLRTILSAIVYLVGAWFIGAVSPADFRRFRHALRQ